MLTTEEYNKKLSELRKERNMYQIEVDRINKEMDELESNKNAIDLTIGEYISFDRRRSGGYLYYFHVHKYDKRPRGVTLYGAGFSNSDNLIKKDTTLTVLWNEVDSLKIVSEKEFYNVFDEHVSDIRKKLENNTDYKPLGDQFEFKELLQKGKIKLVPFRE